MIEIRNLCVVYKKAPVFQNFSATIESKGITLILGPSGSGKTTLLNCIAHRVPYRGNIDIDGKTYRKNDAIFMKKISYCSFESFLFEEESITDFLFRCYSMNRREDIFYYLERYGLFRYRFERIDALSVGQKSLLKMIYCFLSEAEYLLFDEPTASLDRNRIRLFIEDIHRLSQTKAIVISTHENILIKETSRHIEVRARNESISDRKNVEIFQLPRGKEERKFAVSESRWKKKFLLIQLILPFLIGLFLLFFNDWVQTRYLNEDELLLLNENSETSLRMSDREFASIIDGCDDIDYGGVNPGWGSGKKDYTFIYKNRIEITLDGKTVQSINGKERDCVIYEKRNIENERTTERVNEIRISERLFSWISDFFPEEEVKIEDLKLKYGSAELAIRSCYPDKKIEISMPFERLFMKEESYDPLEIVFGMPDGYHDPTVSYIGSGSRLDLKGWDETDVRIEENNRVYFPNEEIYQSWVLKEDIDSEVALFLPYDSEVNIIEGSAPSTEKEILLPSYFKECGVDLGDLAKGYSVCGFYEDTVFKSDLHYFAYALTETAYSGKVCNDPVILRCSRKKEVQRYLEERGYIAVDNEEYFEILMQPITSIMIGSSAAILIVMETMMILIEMRWIDRENQKMFLLGVHRGWFMKERVRSLIQIPLSSVIGQVLYTAFFVSWMIFFPYTWFLLRSVLIPFWISTGASVGLIAILQGIKNFNGQAV